jgi:hypothetical protein
MSELGKAPIVLGLVVVGLGRWSFSLPLGTSVLLSLLLTPVLWLLGWR